MRANKYFEKKIVDSEWRGKKARDGFGTMMKDRLRVVF